jgi:hypothetical protein
MSFSLIVAFTGQPGKPQPFLVTVQTVRNRATPSRGGVPQDLEFTERAARRATDQVVGCDALTCSHVLHGCTVPSVVPVATATVIAGIFRGQAGYDGCV